MGKMLGMYIKCIDDISTYRNPLMAQVHTYVIYLALAHMHCNASGHHRDMTIVEIVI